MYEKKPTKRYNNKSNTVENDEYGSCTWSTFDVTPMKLITRSRHSKKRNETSKLDGDNGINVVRVKYNRNNDRGSSMRRELVESTKQHAKRTERLEKRSSSIECTCPPFSTLQSGEKHFGEHKTKPSKNGRKYRSKSLGDQVHSSVFKVFPKNASKLKAEFKKSPNVNVNEDTKARKTERKYSRRNVRRADAVTEVTSLEIVKTWSNEALGSIVNLNTKAKSSRPSRKTTKVIFARYSQDSIDDNLSSSSSFIEDHKSSENENCICPDYDNKIFNADDKLVDFSSETLDFIGESSNEYKVPFFNGEKIMNRKISCDCYSCRKETDHLANNFDKYRKRNRDLTQKTSIKKSKRTKRRSSPRKMRVTKDVDVKVRLSRDPENLTKLKNTESKRKKVVTREKLCNIFNSPETNNMMNCGCMASQLECRHGCSIDCRCPESYFPYRNRSLENSKCKRACNSQVHHGTAKASRNIRAKAFARRSNWSSRGKNISTIADNNDKKKKDSSKISSIGYVENNCGDEYEDETSDITLTEKHYSNEVNQCPTVISNPTDDYLNLEDLCPDVAPPDHWSKYGEHLSRVTEEYRTLTSRLRDIQREAKNPEILGQLRKRISRKYPSGKEFSFEVKMANDDYTGLQTTLDFEDRGGNYCLCEEPVENLSATWRDESSGSNRADRYLKSEKTVRDRSIHAITNAESLQCDCRLLEMSKRKKRRNESSAATNLVKDLQSFCAKAKAMDRELDASIITNKDIGTSGVLESKSCVCSESEVDDGESEFFCQSHCDACVGKNTENIFKRGESEDASMVSSLVKPRAAARRKNLKKILIYPPDGEAGPPLTLVKKSSDIDLKVVSDVSNGFRYNVIYTQTFVSPVWYVDDDAFSLQQSSDEYQSTGDYG